MRGEARFVVVPGEHFDKIAFDHGRVSSASIVELLRQPL